MASLLTINHHINDVNNYVESVEHANNTYYMFVSRPQPWANSSGGDDDSAVQVVNDSITQVELDTYNDMLYGKKIDPADIVHVAPRYNWVSNTVYPQYDQSDANLYSKGFYVVTDQFSVFKCVDNAAGKVSTVKPTLTATSGTFQTGDGYTWKYMYSVDSTSNSRFTSASFIPVLANSAVVGNAVPGTIDVIRVANGGTGYSVYESGFIDSITDTLTIKLSDESSASDGYYVRSSIYLKSGFGAGQVREIVAYAGTTRSVTIDSAIDSFTRLDFANSATISGGTVGETVRQEVDSINYVQSTGYFSAGANIVQTTTGVAATILTANSNVLRVSKFNKDQNFTAGFAIRDLADTGALRTDKVNISNASTLGLGIVVTPGSGYTANAIVTISSNSGVGGAANAQANSTGKIVAINISNTGGGYTSEPTITVAAPTAQTFNANTDITNGVGEGANNVISLATASAYVIGDRIRYTVSAGNTSIGGLTNNTIYFIQFSNSTVVALSNTSNTAAGNRIALTRGPTETGHSLQGLQATARIVPTSMFAVNTAASSTLATEYSVGNFLRIGENANNNIKKISSVNSTVIIVDSPFTSTLSSANTFRLSTALIPSSITTTIASGIISNTNLDSIRLTIANTSIPGASFILGERVDFVTSANASLNANGTVAYANTSTLFIAGVSGTWYSGQRVRGNSSSLTADIVTVDSNPNITINNPAGAFTLGEPVDFRSSTGSNTGIAILSSIVNLSRGSIEYEIAPTVKITGDGAGAIAVSTVNGTIGFSNSINSISVISSGSGYTQANIEVYSNTLYGSGAVVTPVISPLSGHGSDPISELGARYAGITVKFDTTSNESWYYPSNVSFRRVGILMNPKFANATVETVDYTTVDLTLTSQVGSLETDEYVLQATTSAVGRVSSSNSTSVRLYDTRGTFIQSNTITGLSSGATANVSSVASVRFIEGEDIRQVNTSATAKISLYVGNTTLYLSNVAGQLANGHAIRGLQSNAVATVNSIFSSDGSRNLSTTFAKRFNQTSRLTVGSNTGAFVNFETITQAQTSASAVVIQSGYDLDLQVNSVSGSFSVGDTIINSNTAANAKCVFANSTYLKLTAVSNSSLFPANSEINNGLGSTATVQNTYPVIIVSDVSRTNNFQSGSQLVTGQDTGSVATLRLVTNPDLYRESGKVLYIDNSNNVVTRSLNSTEELRLIIKF
jgi:hypothetical protein